MTGAWEGRFGDTALTYHLYGDGTSAAETDRDNANENGTQLYFGSGFARTGQIGMWRMQDNELVFYDDEARWAA